MQAEAAAPSASAGPKPGSTTPLKSTKQPEASQDVPSAPKASVTVEDDDDDDDDDELDDLDDVLDDFTAKPETSRTAEPTASDSDGPASLDQAEFEKQLRAQMEAVFRDLGEAPGMKDELESLLGSIGQPDGQKPAPKPASKPAAEPTGFAAGSAFEEQIRRAIGRMQESGEQATAAASASNDDDILLDLLKSLDGSGTEGPDGSGSIASAISNIMSALLAKEILYEPMVELNTKFPAWLAANDGKLEAANRDRYQLQCSCVSAIVARFEQADYSDDKPADRAFIQEHMDKMQAASSPPADLVDEGAVHDMLQQSAPGCGVQ